MSPGNRQWSPKCLTHWVLKVILYPFYQSQALHLRAPDVTDDLGSNFPSNNKHFMQPIPQWAGEIYPTNGF